MLLQDKKGVSIMIGYVLLVGITIVMSLVVYQFIKTYVPKDALECPDGVSIFIKGTKYDCDNSTLDVTIKNNGRFNVAGYFIHATTSADQELATEDLSGKIDATDPSEEYRGSIVFGLGVNGLTPVYPNEKTTKFDLNLEPAINNISKIEIIPVRFQEEEEKTRFVSCSNARVEEVLSCWESCTPTTCSILGYECGLVSDGCEGVLDCGSCASSYDCISGTCELNTIEFLKSLGAISWWKLEGNANDEIGGNTGVIVGADCTVTGQYGQGCNFDGTNDYIALDMYYDTAGQISKVTSCAWFKVASGQGGWSLIDFDRSEYYNLEIGWTDRSTDVVNFATTDTSTSTHDLTGTANVRDNQWNFACGVYDGTDKIIYVNGTEDNRATNAHGGDNLGTGNTRYGFIGDGSEATTFDGARNEVYFNGTIDEVIIFNTSLNDTEIQQLYNLDLS